jgi:hypothetical protein
VVSVTSDEPVNGLGDGNTAPDWTVTSDLAVSLRAERAGGGDGRIYKINIECKDAFANRATAPVTVSVPHSMRPK